MMAVEKGSVDCVQILCERSFRHMGAALVLFCTNRWLQNEPVITVHPLAAQDRTHGSVQPGDPGPGENACPSNLFCVGALRFAHPECSLLQLLRTDDAAGRHRTGGLPRSTRPRKAALAACKCCSVRGVFCVCHLPAICLPRSSCPSAPPAKSFGEWQKKLCRLQGGLRDDRQ